jgi:hypothetical protein
MFRMNCAHPLLRFAASPKRCWTERWRTGTTIVALSRSSNRTHLRLSDLTMDLLTLATLESESFQLEA